MSEPIDEEAIDDRLVLADLLMQRGEPLGELLSVHRALEVLAEDAPAAKRRLLEAQIARVLTAHHAALFGPLAPHVQAPDGPAPRAPALEIEWGEAFALSASIESPGSALELADIYRALRSLPLARFLRRLEVGRGDYTGFMAALAADPAPALADLTLRGQREILAASQLVLKSRERRRPAQSKPSHVHAVLDGELFARLPALHTLGLYCSFDRLLPIDAPALRYLAVWHVEDDDALVRSSLPALELLRVNRSACSPEVIERLPSLVDVSAMHCSGIPALLRRLITSPCLPRLRKLELWACGLADEDLAFITAHAEHFAHLEALKLISHELSPPVVSAAVQALPRLHVR